MPASMSIMIKTTLKLLAISIGTLVCLSSVSAEETPAQGEKQAGFIDIELDTAKEVTSYDNLTSNLIKKLSDFAKLTKEPSKITLSEAPVFNTDELNYLAAVHLHCTLISGSCPLIPAALLEIDLVRSTKKGTAHCAALTPFWKQWIESDMEKRVDQNLKVTLFNQRTDFKQNIRPKYLRCQSTIKDILSTNSNHQELLVARYADGKEESLIVAKLVQYLEKLNQKIENIFDETGLHGLKGSIK